MATEKEIEKYKELPLSKGDAHIYYFQYNEKIKGFYAIEKDKYYLSMGIILQILDEKDIKKLENKYFNVSPFLQKKFYAIKDIDKIFIPKMIGDWAVIIKLILENKKRGSPRKYIVVDRINIQLTQNLTENCLEELN